MTTAEYKEWLLSLKVGDEVMVCMRSWGGSRYLVRFVERITPSGLIGTSGNLYYPTSGRCRGDSDYSIKPVDQVVLKKQYDDIVKRKAINKIRDITFQNITVEQANQILEILKEVD